MVETKSGQRLEDFALTTPTQDFWVFGYGSLMWNPGFDFVQAAAASVYGHHRAFAMRSVRHRGMAARPGLVLTLCPGGSCTGRAFQVAAKNAREVCAYLLDREIGTYAYRPAWVQMQIDQARYRALTFLPTKGAPQFVPRLTLNQQAAAIAEAVGGMGPNHEYLRKTIEQMRALGLTTSKFDALERRVDALRKAP